MADNDLEIRVRSSADLSALKQAESAIDDLASRTQKINRSEIDADTARFQKFMESHADDVPGVTHGYQGLTSVSAAMERLGVNVARTRNEFTTLVREMASGAPVSRTLGALLGALGFKLVGLAAAIVGPFILAGKAAKETAEQTEKINESVGDQVEALDSAAEKWESIARSATTTKDVAKLAAEGAEIFRSTADKTRQVQAEQLGVISKLVELLVNSATPIGGIVGQAWKPFTNSLKEAQAEQQKMRDNTEEEVSRIVDVAKKSADQWQNLFAQPVGESISELSAKIIAYKGYLDSIDTKPGPGFEARMKDYQITSQRISEFNSQLQSLLESQKQQLDIDDASLSSQQKLDTLIKAISEDLRGMGITAENSGQALKQALSLPPEQSAKARELIHERSRLIEQQGKGLARDILEAPDQFTREAQQRMDQRRAEELARRAEGHPFTQQEQNRFFLEEERRSLMREQTLALGLIPPGYENTPENYLGTEGGRKFRQRANRLMFINGELGTPAAGGSDTLTSIVEWLIKIYHQWQ